MLPPLLHCIAHAIAHRGKTYATSSHEEPLTPPPSSPTGDGTVYVSHNASLLPTILTVLHPVTHPPPQAAPIMRRLKLNMR